MTYYLMIIIGLLAYLIFTVSDDRGEKEIIGQLKKMEEKIERLSKHSNN